jgi:hypothetical protein
MCEGAAAANWVSKQHYSMPRSGFRAFFLIGDWVHGLLMCVAGSVMVLSSIKMGAPASKRKKEGM